MRRLKSFSAFCQKLSGLINKRPLQIRFNHVCSAEYRAYNRTCGDSHNLGRTRTDKLSEFRNILISNTCVLSRLEQTFKLSSISLNRRFHTFSSRNITMGKSKKKNSSTKIDPGEAVGSKHKEQGSNNRGLKKLQPFSKIPTRINLVVIGTGGPGAPQSLLVTTEYTRYMFNCGEGTQRLAAMSKSLRVSAYAKLAGLEHIFITHKSWENMGGLLGIAMTLEGQKNPDSKAYVKEKPAHGKNSNSIPEIRVHGPEGVENFAMMAKKFSVQANMNVVRHKGEFKDTALTITPILIHKQTADVSALEDFAPSPAKRQKQDLSTNSSTSSVAYAYLCMAHHQLPKINVEKCLDAGVVIGPMVGRLQRGESVVLEDGRVVHPDQVTDSVATNERPFLILECPSLEFLPSLRECPSLRPYMDKLDNSLDIIVHMTPADVFNSPGYQSWMSGFHDSTNHMVLNREAGEVDLVRVREHQTKLNIVSNDVFPMLPSVDDAVVNGVIKVVGEGDAAAQQTVKHGQVVKACAGLHYVYRGKDELGFKIELDEFRCKDIQEEHLGVPEIEEQLVNLRKNVPASSIQGNDTDTDEENLTSYPKVTFLGTGSSEPNLIRAQSCIVAQVSKHSAFMLDCGEDSYGQLYRFFGKARAGKILRKIKAIFLSHLHADHHLGLFSILKERKIAFDEKNYPFIPVLLIAPIQIRRWLRFYHTELEPVTHLFRFVKHQQNLSDYEDGVTLQAATFEDIMKELNLTEYKSVEVEHCKNAYGVSFTHANGFKLVYSGDTRPCDRLVKEGKGCDLLIHEATHEDILNEHAKVSKHSTFSEAIDVGKRMQAKNIILTHFSQRYPYMVPLFDVTLPQNVGVAFDNMQVCPKTMRYLPHMIPALTALFACELQKFETRIARRQLEERELKDKQSSKYS